jgi:hypothetical protein
MLDRTGQIDQDGDITKTNTQGGCGLANVWSMHVMVETLTPLGVLYLKIICFYMSHISGGCMTSPTNTISGRAGAVCCESYWKPRSFISPMIDLQYV